MLCLNGGVKRASAGRVEHVGRLAGAPAGAGAAEAGLLRGPLPHTLVAAPRHVHRGRPGGARRRGRGRRAADRAARLLDGGRGLAGRRRPPIGQRVHRARPLAAGRDGRRGPRRPAGGRHPRQRQHGPVRRVAARVAPRRGADARARHRRELPPHPGRHPRDRAPGPAAHPDPPAPSGGVAAPRGRRGSTAFRPRPERAGQRAPHGPLHRLPEGRVDVEGVEQRLGRARLHRHHDRVDQVGAVVRQDLGAQDLVGRRGRPPPSPGRAPAPTRGPCRPRSRRSRRRCRGPSPAPRPR